MANPWMLFENVYEDGAITANNEDASYPVENVIDWREDVRFRSSTTTALQTIDVDLGTSFASLPHGGAPDAACIAGHNLATVADKWRISYSDNGSAWTDLSWVDVQATNIPHLTTWSGQGAHRYWRLTVGSVALSAVMQLGILTVGRRLTLPKGPTPAMDAYGRSLEGVWGGEQPHGSRLERKTRNVARRFQMRFGPPGFRDEDFFAPASGLGWDDDFRPHALVAGKPFFFAWNSDTEADPWLCVTEQARMPSVGKQDVRELAATFEGWRPL